MATATNVFADQFSSLFSTYHVALQFRGKLLGGIPNDPKIIEGWLRAKAGITDQEEIRNAMLRTLVDLGAEVSPSMSYEELVKASESVAAMKQTSGFKRDENGLYIEGRQVKAGIKESVNILFAGERWGVTKKGPKNFTAERVFVNPERIYLGRNEPDGIEMSMVHLNGPQGPRSSLNYSEYVQEVTISFDVLSTKDEVKEEQWPSIWLHFGENGLGATRSQSYGRFDVIKWEKAKAGR